jgi:hypothetical protein
MAIQAIDGLLTTIQTAPYQSFHQYLFAPHKPRSANLAVWLRRARRFSASVVRVSVSGIARRNPHLPWMANGSLHGCIYGVFLMQYLNKETPAKPSQSAK